MSTILLIDGHSQAYRAYFGMKTPLSTSSGELTAAVYGFTRKLLSVMKEVKPDCVTVAFDVGDTWRHSEFPDYKATRERMPDDLRPQLERIQELLKAFDIPIATYPNYEADDVLGTLARQAADKGYDVLILTGDRDMFQLVDEHIKILYTSGGPRPKTTAYGLKEVEKRYGLTPQQFIDLKALTGDASDNIPGIPGVGEKTAIKWLKQYGALENIYAHADEIRGPKTRQNLLAAKEQVMLNKRLVTIVTDLDLDYDVDRCRLHDFDRDKVAAFFDKLEFHSLLRDLPPSNDQSETPAGASGQLSLFGGGAALPEPGKPHLPDPDAVYETIQDEAALARLAETLGKAPLISFDVETTSKDAMRADLVGLGVCWEAGQAAYIPVGHAPEMAKGGQLPWETVKAALQPAFADGRIPKLAHNGKYDLTVCLRHGLDVTGDIYDTMVMAWLLDPGSRSLGLKAQAWHELGWRMTELSDLIGSGRKQITMDAAPVELAAPYCCADTDATIRLFDILAARLKEAGMWDLYMTIEEPLLPVLTDMEMAGILLDTDFLKEMSQRLTQRLADLTAQLYKLVGHEFNLRSTQQLSKVLFEELGFPSRGMKKTSSGNYSTAVGNLEKLAERADQLSATQRQVLEIIFEQRQLEKLRSTYVDALPALVNPETGRVHTSFNQTGAVTGRMSSSNPNLQNIPIRTDLGREIRRAFIAPPGWSLISADYSQVELRVLAHVANEQGLIQAFLADQDIHKATAARLFGVPIDQVDRHQRGVAKTINFATVYGSSAFGISNRTELTPAEAQVFLDQYFETYPAIRTYVAETIEQANERGYVETLLGRKRFFPDLKNKRLPHNQRQALERAAINAPIQGTAADIMKLAMIYLHERLKEGDYRTRMLLQVHDELVLETPADEVKRAASLVREVMESAYTLVVPLKVDVEVGPNWYNMEKI